MKRLVIIAAAALVPFAVLVWWGLAALQEPAPVTPAVVAAPAAPAVLPSERPLPAPVAAPAPAPPAPALSPAEEREDAVEQPPAPVNETKAREAVIEQLTPVVQTCLLDLHDRLKQHIRVAAAFETNPDGTLTNVRVKMKSADPYLVACVQDALEGAHLEPKRGLPANGMKHVFTFNSPGGK